MRLAWILVVASAMQSAAIGAPTKKAPTPHQTASVSLHKIPQSGVLDASDLVAIARLHLNNSTDQFSDDPTLAYVGREFTITVGADDLSTDYDKTSRTLKVSTPTYSDGFKLAESIAVSRYVGQNGYGAKAAVTKRRGNTFGVWIPGESYNRVPITYTAILDGPAARDLSKSIKVRLTGAITRADGVYAEKDSAIYKKLMYADATVSDPYEMFIEQYFVSVAFTKAEWIDGRSGDILGTVALGHE
jgi:hypothetical protein